VKSAEETLFQNTNRFPKYVYISADRFCFLYAASRKVDLFVCHIMIMMIIIIII